MRHLDGVSFLAGKIGAACREADLRYEIVYQAKDEGYYAAHITVFPDFEVPAMNWDTLAIRGGVEIQVTTEVQDLIARLLHRHYERRRSQPTVPGEMWQWDYASEEFATNYLGHILHYVEGMIVELREGRSGRN